MTKRFLDEVLYFGLLFKIFILPSGSVIFEALYVNKFLKMKSFLLYTLFYLIFFQASAQFSGINIIDDDQATMGIRYMASADFNNNGFNDIITAHGTSIDQITIYWNSGNANFTNEVIDNTIDDPVFINFGDFNSNGFKDLLVVTESNSEIFFYENIGGIFQNRVQLGSVQSFGKSIAVEDFDGDGDLDFVVIGQHSIDLYRNNGNANFTMEHILTTATSPNILECWTMVLVDVNGDGNPDVVTGETIGIVAYINDGNANFTPQTVSESQHHTVNAIDAFDANGNSIPDLVFHSSSEIGVYLNQSTGATIDYDYHGQLFSMVPNDVRHIKTGDFTQNGSNDLFFTHQGVAYYAENLSGMVFSSPTVLYSDPDLFIWMPLAADITGNGINELIWAAAGGTIAYHTLENLGVDDNEFSWSIYPNPVTRSIKISNPNALDARIDVYTVDGRLVLSAEKTLPAELDVNALTTGTYILKIQTAEGSSTKKVIKQ